MEQGKPKLSKRLRQIYRRAVRVVYCATVFRSRLALLEALKKMNIATYKKMFAQVDDTIKLCTRF